MFEKLNSFMRDGVHRAIDADEPDKLVNVFNNIATMGILSQSGLAPRMGIPEPRNERDIGFYRKAVEHPKTYPLTRSQLETVLRIYERHN